MFTKELLWKVCIKYGHACPYETTLPLNQIPLTGDIMSITQKGLLVQVIKRYWFHGSSRIELIATIISI